MLDQLEMDDQVEDPATTGSKLLGTGSMEREVAVFVPSDGRSVDINAGQFASVQEIAGVKGSLQPDNKPPELQPTSRMRIRARPSRYSSIRVRRKRTRSEIIRSPER